MSYGLGIMSFEVIFLNRVQIYDCEIGVVKCFAVYFSSPMSSAREREKENIFSPNELWVCYEISKPKLFKSFQKSGYDFETTSAFSIIIGTFTAKGANAIAIL